MEYVNRNLMKTIKLVKNMQLLQVIWNNAELKTGAEMGNEKQVSGGRYAVGFRLPEVWRDGRRK